MMTTLVVSYSFTGNHEGLASRVAEMLGADHVRITESRRRAMMRIILDRLFDRVPDIHLPAMDVGAYDLVLFAGPVWMGLVASPFRACFDELGPALGSYAFLSISGGADGPNPEVAGDLTQRLGKAPVCLIDLYVADLLPPDPKPTRQDTMAYRINADEVERLAEVAVAKLVETVEGDQGLRHKEVL
jgi:hypothetical protein